jgi:hypothetical protein
VMNPLLLVLAIVAVVGLLMLGGRALTSGAPQVPAGHQPAPSAGATTSTSSDGGQSGAAQAVAPAGRQVREAAPPRSAARVLETQPAGQDGNTAPRAAGPVGAVRRSARRAAPPQRTQDEQAAERAGAQAAAQQAALRRAEQLRQAEIARQADAAKRAEAAERAAQRAGDDDEAGGE